MPGVGLGFHSDVTKSSQYTPQISGGNGRNINYLVDGGDNNDDTVGGLLQLFPLEAIQEFNVMTQRFDAEYGRGDGGVLNVVTKSGTNDLRGSWFTLFRDDALNARTFTEQLSGVGQAGLPALSVRRQPRRADRREPGALLRRVRAHAAGHEAGGQHRAACSRRATASTTSPVRENLFTGKLTATLSTAQYLARPLRRATPTRSRAAPGCATRPSRGRRAATRYNSVNAQPQLGRSAGRDSTSSSSSTPTSATASRRASRGPALLFPERRRAPGRIRSRRRRRNRRSGSSATMSASTLTGLGGLGHDLKVGVNWLHEPRLFTSTASLFKGQYTFTGAMT